jgi:predicted RNase H-like HicB family nuclease
MRLRVETKQERPGRWIADVVTLPGVMAYGRSRAEAVRRAKALALEVIADRVRHGENPLTGRAPAGGSERGSRSRFQGLEFVAA